MSTAALAPRRSLPSLERYGRHREATARWLLRSIERGRGGSCAHFSLAGGWSRPYPETTGYLIPTLFALEDEVPSLGPRAPALVLGGWLASIQNADGSWNGGLHPARRPRPSVFNTGQILKGMAALFDATGEERWLEAARRGARWLAAGVGAEGLWSGRDYRASETPSYYTHAAWPMLEVWKRTGEEPLRDAAERFLARVLARRRENGSFERWGFGDSPRAFTHTIAYTLRGLLESARILGDWERYGAPAADALERLLKKAELAGGWLPGELDGEWHATSSAVCLTGSAQTAINLLLWERQEPDLRIVNAAAKLVDRVCETQHVEHPIAGVRGAVAGSWPLWGGYMTLRYPNWAAKYHADALTMLERRLAAEAERAA
ncbi:MAG TPA: hypothetical protein VMS76_19470 [Planctomycetota bacterium]|nr:hypothetical protein [Planctomycetota bacterium]